MGRKGMGRALLALVVTVSMLVGCGSAVPGAQEYERMKAGLSTKVASLDREVIADGLARELEQLEGNAVAALAADFDGLSAGQLSEFGVDAAELCQHLLARLTFTIGAVTLDGNRAEVPVTVTNIDLASALAAANEAMSGSDTAGMVDAYLNGESVDLLRETARIIYDTIDSIDQLHTTETSVHLTKVDGHWSLDEESSQELVTAILGGYEFVATEAVSE